jgi:NAD(P)-dependent dehydrogenase (short-subunit alcohol dehydrogenase family)
MESLAGKTALVTGAASGIGQAIALACAAQSMRLVIADINAEGLAETAAALGDTPHITATLDTRDRAAWAALFARAEAELGPVQLLCNVAGVTLPLTPALEITPEAWQFVLDINLTGTFHGGQLAANRLRELGLPGHIVNTASVQGLFAAPEFAAYTASKFAVVGLSETLRMELADHNIGVSVLCPGAVATKLFATSAAIAPQHVPSGGGGKIVSGFSHRQTPAQVADQVITAVKANVLYIMTHPEFQPVMEARFQAMDASFARNADPAAVANVLSMEEVPLAIYGAAGGKR